MGQCQRQSTSRRGLNVSRQEVQGLNLSAETNQRKEARLRQLRDGYR